MPGRFENFAFLFGQALDAVGGDFFQDRIDLLRDKEVDTGGVTLEKAVGMRLTFRQPPPIKCFSNQFLFYLNASVASTAYDTWAAMSPKPVSALPPERFTFQVVNMSID